MEEDSPTASMRLGDYVLWEGRVYVLHGFEPMSIPNPSAFLADLRTGWHVCVPADQLEPLREPARRG